MESWPGWYKWHSDCLTVWLSGLPAEWVSKWPPVWFKGCLTVWLINLCWITEWCTDSRAGRLIEQQWFTHWDSRDGLTDWLTNINFCRLTYWSTDLLPTMRETFLIDWLIILLVPVLWMKSLPDWYEWHCDWLTYWPGDLPSECFSVEVTSWLTVWPLDFLLSLWLDYSLCKGWILNQWFCWLCYPVNA